MTLIMFLANNSNVLRVNKSLHEIIILCPLNKYYLYPATEARGLSEACDALRPKAFINLHYYLMNGNRIRTANEDICNLNEEKSTDRLETNYTIP